MAHVRLEVWSRPGAAGYTKKVTDLPYLEASVSAPYSGVGKGSMALAANYDRLDDILSVDLDTPAASKWSTIKLVDELGVLYEWLPTPRVPPGQSKSDTKVDFSGDGIESIWGFARVEPWDWDGSVDWIPKFPDWIYGGRNLLTNEGFEDSSCRPEVNEIRYILDDPDTPVPMSGSFFVTDGVDSSGPYDTTTVNAVALELGLEADIAAIDDVNVTGDGSEADPFVITFVSPCIFPGGLFVTEDPGDPWTDGYVDIFRTQFGALMPDPWTKSQTVSMGVQIVHGDYDSFRVTTAQAHSGTYSLLIDPAVIGRRYAGAQQILTVQPNGLYQASVWVRTASAGQQYRFVIRGIDEDLLKLADGSDALVQVTPAANTWTQITLTDVVVGDNTQIIFRIANINVTGNPAIFYVDDASFNEGMEPTTVGRMLTELYDDATNDHVADGRLVWEDGDNPGTPYLHLDFSPTLDSDEVAWDRSDVSQTFKPRMTYLQVIDQIAEEGYEWRIVPGGGDDPENPTPGHYLLQVYNPGTLGVTAAAGIVAGSSDTTRGVRYFAPALTDIVVQGSEGLSMRDRDTALAGAFGVIEGSMLDEELNSAASLTAAATAQLADQLDGGEALVYTLTQPAQEPLRLYRPGDRITVHDLPLVDGTRRVSQIQVSLTKDQADTYVVQLSDAAPFHNIGGGVVTARGLVGQAATDNAVAALLKAFHKPTPLSAPSHVSPGMGGSGSAPTVVVAAADSNEADKAAAALVCQGVDDNITIQQAILACGLGGRVVLCQGNYDITGQISVPHACYFYGLSREGVELNASVAMTSMVYLSGASSDTIQIANITMNGGGFATYGMTIEQGCQVALQMDNVVVDNFDSDGIHFFRPAGTGSRVSNSRFQNNGGHGFYVREMQIDFVDCQFISNGGNGLSVEQWSERHVIGCLFDSNGAGGLVGSNALSGGQGSIIVVDCHFLGNGDFGLENQSGGNWVIANNIFEANTGGSMSFGAGGFGNSVDNLIIGNVQVGAGTFTTYASGSDGFEVTNVVNGVLTSGPAFELLYRSMNSDFFYAGTLVTGVGAQPRPWTQAGTIVDVKLAVGTAPTGADVIVDVNKNGTTIFTTQANRPRVVAGNTVGADAVPDVTAMAIGDVLTVDIDQIGSTIAGANLTLVVEWRPG